MIKVLLVFGTRPEAIKMAPLVKELQSRPQFSTTVCITAQHREMLDQVLELFRITPDYDLNIMKREQGLTDITTTVLTEMQRVISEVKPDIVLVHGDTTTTFAGALAAFYQQVPIGHVEAGLRTWDKYSPYPEEMNRQFVDCMCDLYFAPTEQSKQNLLAENRPEQAIYVTGNTVIDALQTTVQPGYTHPLLEWCKDSRLVLLTAHRRENLGAPMRDIFTAVRRLVEEIPDIKVIYPVHMNPKVRQVADEVLADNPKIRLVEPLEAFDFHNFINAAHIILTDSGGIQEEAPSLGKPVLVLRNTTERPEGVAGGTLKLVGTDAEAVYRESKNLLQNPAAYDEMSRANNPYGDGQASRRIADILLQKFADRL